jgi:hypothetical protein
MRALITGAVAATVFATASGSAFAFDPLTGQGWQPSRPPAVMAYFKLTFNAPKTEDKVAYGIALTAPTLRGYGTSPVSLADTPKLLDLRFKDAVPDTLHLTGQVAWTRDPSQLPGDQRLNLFGGIGGFVLGLATTAAVAYGVYALVKKKCPAISTTTGGCVKTSN